MSVYPAPPSTQAVPTAYVSVPISSSAPPPSTTSASYQTAPHAQQHHHHQHVRPHGEWVHGLCSCCHEGIGQCCISYWLFPCQLSKNCNSVKSHSHPSCWSCPGCFCAFCCTFCAACMVRGRIRERVAIPGSCCGDCCTTFFCACCAQIQETNTLVKVGTPARLFMDEHARY